MPANEPVLFPSNRSYRYGDGLFETMKVMNEEIILAPFHFERLFAGLSLLKFKAPESFTVDQVQEQILSLCKKTKCESLARVRLSIFRGNGGLYNGDEKLQYLIECSSLNESTNKLNENGLVIDIYTKARKTCDEFSNLKSANFLPYVMASLYAKENKLDDCLVLNTSGNIADATIANIFLIKDKAISTPSLAEGCVAGVMRKCLLEKLQNVDYKIRENSVSVSNIENADEIFLTNSINGIRWVRQFRNKIYSNSQIEEIYNRFIKMN